MSVSLPFRAAFLFLLFATTLAFSADGKTLLAQGHFRQLYGVAQERLNRNSNDAEALSWMSAIYDAYGDFDRAVDFARRATEAAPNSSEFHCQFADILGDKALKLGILGGGIPLARQMRHELDLSLQLDPRSVRCLKESMGLYEQEPAIIGGSKTKARETLQQIYRISPAEGALAEAMLLQMQKRPLPDIEFFLRRAVQLNPRLYRAVIDLTSILDSDGYRHYSRPNTLPAWPSPPIPPAPQATAIWPAPWPISSTGAISMPPSPRPSAAFQTMPRPCIPLP